MTRNARRGKNRRDWKNQNEQNGRRRRQGANLNGRSEKVREAVFHRHVYANIEAERQKEAAIRALKTRSVICPICGKPIEDMASAIDDKATGQPAHFDCILEKINKSEMPGERERVAYIGQGKFAVLRYENPRDIKSFKIVKTIEWEATSVRQEWRSEMSGLYSQVL